ncbi:MAG: hypothetical protein EU532_01875 [Promethearchaeota archaeon]|nr:MAG: hypothetical protein EU532_01875 [Candidatus Lokiarchaeota archaeon]
MLNQYFKENWLKILDFNKKVEIIDEPSITKENFRIPLTPININAYVLYYLFELLYPKFINDQQNIIDLIISNNVDEILGLYLYKTKRAGIHESFERLSNDIIKIQEEDLVNIEQFFNQTQVNLVKTTGSRISSIRIFKQKAIDLINQHCKFIKQNSINDSLINLLKVVQKLYNENLFYIYPVPNFFRFIKNSLNLLNGINLSNLYKILYEILSKLNISIIFDSTIQPLLLNLKKTKSEENNPEIFIELLSLQELGIKIRDFNKLDILNSLKKTTKSEKIYLINQIDLISLLLDIFEFEFPPTFDKIKMILQKLLFGIRNFENKWYMLPRPKVYNNLLRFLTRIFRFNLNFKKISHWTIPEFAFNILETNFGLKSKILIILTEINKRNFNEVEYIKNAIKSAILIEYEDRRIVKIIPINKKDLFSEHQINSLDVIRANISTKYGYVSAVMNIDKYLLTEMAGNFRSKLLNFTLFSTFKTLNLFKKEYYFNMFPEIPEFKFMKKVSSNSFLKSLLPILIDKHEF